MNRSNAKQNASHDSKGSDKARETVYAHTLGSLSENELSKLEGMQDCHDRHASTKSPIRQEYTGSRRQLHQQSSRTAVYFKEGDSACS